MTDLELEDIIANGKGHKKKVREKAQLLLGERQAYDESILGPSPGIEFLRRNVKTKTTHFMDPRAYLKSLGIKDVLTIVSLAMTELLLIHLTRYFINEPQLTLFVRIFAYTLSILVFLSAHILYRQDHGRSNNFIGRSLSDLFLFITLGLLFTTHSLFQIEASPFFQDPGQAFGITFLLVFVFLLFEALVSLVIFLFSFLKWRLL